MDMIQLRRAHRKSMDEIFRGVEANDYYKKQLARQMADEIVNMILDGKIGEFKEDREMLELSLFVDRN